ncbi:MFS family permease [Edaphobacter lichenicola]|uniref:MFS family permease n=1 Tax=Tunturiibacter lichenicola TaxID=2051959 RepID=A0A852VHD9_9BACT|nr:MFS family permease [Edaphobacter lichenicola]
MHFEEIEAAAASSETGAPGWRFAVAAGILGWILDAFDFFVVVFLISELMGKFHVGKAAIVWSMTLTLAMRPIGALFFGALADKFGRKKPLIACVLYFSAVTVLSGLAPTYWIFMAMRLLYGLGMGGYWGIALPMRWRARLGTGVAFSLVLCRVVIRLGISWRQSECRR